MKNPKIYWCTDGENVELLVHIIDTLIHLISVSIGSTNCKILIIKML